jgi:phage shock protein PspC (stress-responsive transcriptional regulator)
MSETIDQTPRADPSEGHAPPALPQLTRSRTDRKVAGVCGGLGAHLGIDPLVLRLVIVVLTLFGGSGLILYALGWLLIPGDGETRSELQRLTDGDRPAGPALPLVVAAVIALIVIATLIGLGSAFSGQSWGWGWGAGLWPLLLVAGIAGAVWYVRSNGPAPSGPAPSHLHRAREPSALGAVTISLALVAAGTMILLDRIGAWHVHPVPFLAVLLGIVGGGLVVGAFAGRAHGLVALGAVLTLAMAIASAVPAAGARGTGDVTWWPVSTTSIPSHGYSWAAGDATLDLSSTALASDTVVPVSVATGNLLVLVPSDVVLVIRAHVGLGSVVLPDGFSSNGIGRTVDTSYSAVTAEARGTLTLRLDVGAGTLEVRRAQT